MQIVDNLLLVHNLTAKTSQLWDLKLPDYHIPLIPEKYPISLSTKLLSSSSAANNEGLTYLSDIIREEEKLTEETFTKPVMRESGIIDPGNLHMISGALAIPPATGINEERKESANSSSAAAAIDPYDSSSLVYVDPCYVLDMKQYLSMTCKLNLPQLIHAFTSAGSSNDRNLLSLLNRARSKPHFLGHLSYKMLKGELSLIDASKVYMRMNSVYKQASIERQSLKKKQPNNGALPVLTSQNYQYDMLESNLLKGLMTEIVFL